MADGTPYKEEKEEARRVGWLAQITVSATFVTIFVAAFLTSFMAEPAIAWPATVLVAGLVYVQGLQKVPAQPYTMAMRTFFGRPYLVYLRPGWHFFLGYPFIFGMIQFKAEKTNVNREPQDVIAPDAAAMNTEVQYTYTPEDLFVFLHSGGHDGVQEILNDIVEQELRQWAIDPKKHKKRGQKLDDVGWLDVARAPDRAISQLAEAICARKGREVLTEDQKQNLRNGSASIPLADLGIRLNRLNMGEMRPSDSDLAKDASKRARETLQREAETVEIKHVEDLIKRLVNELDFTPQEARDVLQVERKKAGRSINVNELKVSRETREFLESFGGNVLTKLLTRISGGEAKNG